MIYNNYCLPDVMNYDEQRIIMIKDGAHFTFFYVQGHKDPSNACIKTEQKL